jgi:hypothetical protein
MKRVFLILTFGLVSAFAAVSCGGGGGSSLDPNKRVADLTSDEQKQLCDEIANVQGGYGRTMTCPDGHIEKTDVDQASCLGGAPTLIRYCPELTVADNLDCAHSQAEDFCSFASLPECQAVRDCVARIPRS